MKIESQVIVDNRTNKPYWVYVYEVDLVRRALTEDAIKVAGEPLKGTYIKCRGFKTLSAAQRWQKRAYRRQVLKARSRRERKPSLPNGEIVNLTLSEHIRG